MSEHTKKILTVLKDFPDLTSDGFNIYNNQYPTISELQEKQMELFERHEEFNRAVEWLKDIKPKKTTSGGFSSYMLKHWAEKKMGGYISNGAMIAACIYSDFSPSRTLGSLNCRFSMTKKSIKNNMTDRDRYLCN